MAHVQFMDELIREYLLFRGFGSSLKAFDVELKSDKEKSFRVDKIIEQILQFISNYDLSSLRELWSHLDNHMFSKLESHFTSGVKKLENAVLKMYLINAVANSKTDKVMEFFVKLTPDLQNQTEWKDWFGSKHLYTVCLKDNEEIFLVEYLELVDESAHTIPLPYIKNPEENPIFSLHFTKQWQDTLLVSLHNFLASIFQYMPLPTLLNYEEDANKINKLEQRNESLKNRLALLIDRGSESSVTPVQVEPPPHLLDDFYIIAQENNIGDTQAKSLKNLIRNMGTASSPILGRKDNTGSRKRLGTVAGKNLKATHFSES